MGDKLKVIYFQTVITLLGARYFLNDKWNNIKHKLIKALCYYKLLNLYLIDISNTEKIEIGQMKW